MDAHGRFPCMGFRRSEVRILSPRPVRRVHRGLAFFVVSGSFMRNSAHTLYLLDAQEHLLHRAHVGTVAPYTCPRGRDQGHISQISHRRYAHHMTAGDTLRYLPTTWTHAMPLRPALRQRVYPSVAVGRHVRLAPLSFVKTQRREKRRAPCDLLRVSMAAVAATAARRAPARPKAPPHCALDQPTAPAYGVTIASGCR